MAGVTDRPFRMLCKKLGAGFAVSEMVTSNSLLYGSEKTLRRANHEGEVEPISVQIAGADPKMLADAARYNVDHGAQVIDINMGCPAKKICNVMAGSALLKDEPLVSQILKAVVAAVDVPVTLKIRTGWDKQNRNAVAVAKMAEDIGIQALAMHGRTRACAYMGDAEYDTIAEVKQAIKIPLIANGDIIEVLEIYSFKELYGFNFAKVKIRMVDYPNQIPLETVLLLDTIVSESPSLTFDESNRLYQEVMKDYESESTKFKMFQKVKENLYFNALQVKFSYAITCHKSQGGQWNTVFIEQPYLPDGMSKDYIRWLYTAMTRAKNKLYLIGFEAKNFTD
jgi:hypothetical protein